MKNSKYIIRTIPFLALVLIASILPITSVSAEKPFRNIWGHYVDETSSGTWITQMTGVVFTTDEPGVYEVSVTLMFAFVGPDDCWEVTYHYKGTSKSAYSVSSKEFITGKMQYNIQYTIYDGNNHEGDDYDGNWKIWFEDGQIARKVGSGYLWLP